MGCRSSTYTSVYSNQIRTGKLTTQDGTTKSKICLFSCYALFLGSFIFTLFVQMDSPLSGFTSYIPTKIGGTKTIRG